MPTIEQLNSTSSFDLNDLLAIFSAANGNTRKASLGNFITFLQQQQVALGAGVQSALNTDVGTNGSFVVFDEALGTPTSGEVSNTTVLATSSTTERSLAERFADIVNVKDFGAIGDGVTDDTVAVAAWAAYLSINGGIGIWDKGSYLLTSQVTLTPTALHNIHILAAGAEIITTGAISGFKISGSATPHQTTISGLKINHRGNATATAGIEATGTSFLRLRDCTVEAHGVSASYAAVLLHSATPSDPNTACFWTIIDGLAVRKRYGADVGDIPVAVRLQGAANATIIRGSSLSLGTTGNGIEIVPEAGQTYIANGVVIDGVHFEGMDKAVRVSNSAGAYGASGLRLLNCRAESLSTYLSLEGATLNPGAPPILWGNFAVSGVTTYVNNPNGLIFNNMDAYNGVSTGRVHSIYSPDGIKFTSLATQDILTLDAANTGSGIGFTLNGSALQASIRYAASGVMEMAADLASNISWAFKQVRGISQTQTRANNLRGSVTFTGAATKVVVFPYYAEADASYFVVVTGNVSETFFVTAKGTAGFTINSSNAASVAAVDWVLIR